MTVLAEHQASFYKGSFSTCGSYARKLKRLQHCSQEKASFIARPISPFLFSSAEFWWLSKSFENEASHTKQACCFHAFLSCCPWLQSCSVHQQLCRDNVWRIGFHANDSKGFFWKAYTRKQRSCFLKQKLLAVMSSTTCCFEIQVSPSSYKQRKCVSPRSFPPYDYIIRSTKSFLLKLFLQSICDTRVTDCFSAVYTNLW